MDVDKLIKLDELRKSGVLTDVEYAAQKAKLLSDDNSAQQSRVRNNKILVKERI